VTTRPDVQTPEQIVARFDRSLEWATEHTRFPHTCVDGKTYRASCLVSDPGCHTTAVGYIASANIASATGVAEQHGYRAEVHRQTTGDHWDVRIYEIWRVRMLGTPAGYDRRRDVSKADIATVILRMVAAKVAVLDYERANRLTAAEALDILSNR
jgi:hypothetical protein